MQVQQSSQMKKLLLSEMHRMSRFSKPIVSPAGSWLGFLIGLGFFGRLFVGVGPDYSTFDLLDSKYYTVVD
jgi:hypothetical protein